ncbi:SDR family oxidoreductase [Shewanella sp. 10N.7]|uniref:UDP-glucose 4-epimerase family protein n=1 Tax=Shewanella sp. 10N.7 TaxID=2885093 RepID=UPI001E5A387B|nr:SDR family oxidoreductase [Shewanella sp. 10N.7]MCC4831101.1 SDR family oxidoreductase [Shewanella sp. 10N.7]
MILITGANGFLGRHLVGALDVLNLSIIDRGATNSNPKHRYTQAEINSKDDYSSAISGCSTVIHCAARVHVMGDSVNNALELYREVNTLGTANLAHQAAKAGVKRFVFISSIKVNGEGTVLGKPFTSSDAPSQEDFYGISKAEAEQQLFTIGKETGMEIVVIRPTLVYGPGVKANFASLMNLVSKGIPLPFGCIRENRRSLVSVTNLVDLIVTCIDHPNAANETFLVSDDCDVSTSEMVAQMAKALGKQQWQLSVPKWCYKLAGKALGKQDVIDRLLGSLQVDITHTKNTLGWVPPQSFEEGFKQCANAFLQSKQK